MYGGNDGDFYPQDGGGDDDDAADDDDATDDDDAADDDAATDDDDATDEASVRFSAIADVPYDDDEHEKLRAYIAEHNALDPSAFVIHLGDFKPYNTDCSEEVFGAVAKTLRTFEAPVFLVPGDNEYNDCKDPVTALSLWRTTFAEFAQNWNGAPVVQRQETRIENFAWVQDRVLFVGINLVGGDVHDEDEWATRMEDDARWVESNFAAEAGNIDAAVLFSHATLGDNQAPFLARFRAASATLGLPVLYIQGDQHAWRQERPWDEQNILRVALEADGADPVVVSVHASGETFRFERNPFE
jgi:hypothetical protein